MGLAKTPPRIQSQGQANLIRAGTGRIIPFNYWKRRVPIPIPS